MNIQDVIGIGVMGLYAGLIVVMLICFYLVLKNKVPELLVWLSHAFSFMGFVFIAEKSINFIQATGWLQ